MTPSFLKNNLSYFYPLKKLVKKSQCSKDKSKKNSVIYSQKSLPLYAVNLRMNTAILYRIQHIFMSY